MRMCHLFWTFQANKILSLISTQILRTVLPTWCSGGPLAERYFQDHLPFLYCDMDIGVSGVPLLGIIKYAACKIRGMSNNITYPPTLHYIYCKIREPEFRKTTIYFLHVQQPQQSFNCIQ